MRKSAGRKLWVGVQRGGGRVRRRGKDPHAAPCLASPRTWALAEFIGVGAGGGRLELSKAVIDLTVDKSPLYKGGGRGRSSELRIGRQRKVVLGRLLGTVPSQADWVCRNQGLRNWGPAWALGQCHGDIRSLSDAASPVTPTSSPGKRA